MAIYKSTIKTNKIQNNSYDCLEMLECDFKHNNNVLKIITVYRPPISHINKSTLTEFIEEFQQLMSSKSIHANSLYVTGDFNIHVNKTDDMMAAKFTEMMISLGLTQRISEPTHDKGNTLDLLFHRVNDTLVKKSLG